MDAVKYYELLLKLRDEGIRFRRFMGRRWAIVRALGFIIVLVLVRTDDAVDRGLGLILLGYLAGAIAAEVCYFFRTRKYWPCQKEVLNWEKIETLAKEDT